MGKSELITRIENNLPKGASAGSTARKFYDADDNPVTMFQLIRSEPEWAQSRILHLEKLLSDCKAALSQQSTTKETRTQLPEGVTRIRNVATGEIKEVSRQEGEPVAYLWGGVLIRADESHPNHRQEGAPLYRHQPKSLNQSPVAYSWDDNNGFGGSPSRRVEFEYPQHFHGPVTKLYDHAPTAPDARAIMIELRQNCESGNELIPEQAIAETLLWAAKMLDQEALKPAARHIEPSPQGLEEWISSREYWGDTKTGRNSAMVIESDDLRTLMTGKGLCGHGDRIVWVNDKDGKV